MVLDSEDRTRLLNEKLAMSASGVPATTAPAHAAQPSSPEAAEAPAITEIGVVKDDGYEWLQWPQGNGEWWYRRAHSQARWKKWQ